MPTTACAGNSARFRSSDVLARGARVDAGAFRNLRICAELSIEHRTVACKKVRRGQFARTHLIGECLVFIRGGIGNVRCISPGKQGAPPRLFQFTHVSRPRISARQAVVERSNRIGRNIDFSDVEPLTWTPYEMGRLVSTSDHQFAIVELQLVSHRIASRRCSPHATSCLHRCLPNRRHCSAASTRRPAIHWPRCGAPGRLRPSPAYATSPDSPPCRYRSTGLRKACRSARTSPPALAKKPCFYGWPASSSAAVRGPGAGLWRGQRDGWCDRQALLRRPGT